VSGWVDVGSLADLEAAGRLVARIDGRELGVVLDRETGGVHGIRNRCPHHGAPLCHGSVRRRSVGEPGRYALGERRVLRCPWHGWEFDLATGLCADDPAQRAAVYPAEIADGRVRVQI